MILRKRSLPAGWYPLSESDVVRQIHEWESTVQTLPAHSAVSIVVPHAGWRFSGNLAFAAMSSLSRMAETVVIIGGHLPESAPCLSLRADEFEVPGGTLRADIELRDQIAGEIPLVADSEPDNTVEVQLPLVRYLFPQARIVGLRAPASLLSLDLGKAIFRAAEATGRGVVVVGSTDLTHYGVQYGFSPAGSGERARLWVREKNDAGMIDLLLRMAGESSIAYAARERAACSIGAAAAALSYASLHGISEGVLCGYGSSYSGHRSESFVGYAGISYSPA